MTRSLRSVRPLVVFLAAGMALAACASNGSSLEIGFRRVALDLAFREPDLAVPVEPQVIIRRFVDNSIVLPPAPAEPTVIRVQIVVPPTAKFECAVAPEGTKPLQPTFPVVKDPPAVGQYSYHNEGTISVELATEAFDITVPPRSKWDIPRVEAVQFNRFVADQDLDTVGVPDEARDDFTLFTDGYEFDLTRRLTRGFEQTDTYRYTATDEAFGDFLYLVKRVTVANGETETFEPSPPIRIVRLNAPEGNQYDAGVSHGGVDRETNVAMSSVSQIVARESVDVCGEVYDTYRVQIQQQFVDMSKSPPEVSGNEGDTADFWNIQFDNGLLIVREQVNRTLRTSTEVLGQQVPVTIRYNYVSILDKLAADPLPEPAS